MARLGGVDGHPARRVRHAAMTYAVVTTKLRGCGLTLEEAKALAATLIGAEILEEQPIVRCEPVTDRYRREDRARQVLPNDAW